MAVDEGLRSRLEAGLTEWLPRQRWFGHHGPVRAVDCEELHPLSEGETTVLTCVARVDHGGGDGARFHVPVAAGPPGGMRPTDPAALIVDDGAYLVFDALADARTAAPLWRLIAGGGRVDLDRGTLSAGGGGADAAATDIRPLRREQSNTSLVAGKDHLLKVMRRVVFEPSVELEMTRALMDAGFEHVAPAEAWLHYTREGERHGALLALVSRFLHNGTEGWTLALTSLRDLYADAEERGMEGPAARIQAVEDAGGSFTAEAARLGEITASMHLALAAAHGDDLSPEPITAQMLDSWAEEMRGELDRLIEAHPDEVRGIEEHRAAIAQRIDAVRSVDLPGLAIRVHGDFHLGQVLRTDAGWTILDLEGEPRRPVEHRRRRHSPLRDVAGMLRSFDYAASVALRERMAPGDLGWDELAAHGRSWAMANREAFWSAYADATADTAMIPDPGTALTLRRAFEIQKAVYEVEYEIAHRPAWVPVPLAFLLQATG